MQFPRLDDDFEVEELSEVTPRPGRFAFYRLTKRNLGTLEAVAALAEHLQVPRSRIGFGGLKDRHAVTRQFLTIEGGPTNRISLNQLELEYLGTHDREYSSRDVTGNRFRLVIRQLDTAAREPVEKALQAIERDALVNYFDDQRFGSLGASGEFIAAPWCRGDFERSVWLALADENAHDSPEERRAKAVVRRHWGNWSACRAAVVEPHSAKALDHLRRHPGDFRGALVCWPQELRSLWLAAFQSQLWNALAAAWLRREYPGTRWLSLRFGGQALPWPVGLSTGERTRGLATELPLPSARLKLEEGSLAVLIEQVLARAGTSLAALRVKYPRDNFFSLGTRPVLVVPRQLEHTWANDELNAGFQRLTLRLAMPRAAYATLVVKRLAIELDAGKRPTRTSS